MSTELGPSTTEKSLHERYEAPVGTELPPSRLRFRPRARTTRDVDLNVVDAVPPGALASKLVEVHDRLMSAVAQDHGDFFEFTIPPARSELAAAPGGGGVFTVVAKVAGREFA